MLSIYLSAEAKTNILWTSGYLTPGAGKKKKINKFRFAPKPQIAIYSDAERKGKQPEPYTIRS